MKEIRLPFIGPDADGCLLERWLIKPGDTIEIDQDIAELSVDGESFVLPSPLDGIVQELCAEPGEYVTLGETLVKLDEI
ncbi:MAG TPA: hypothetical protein GX391_04000 [Firmicutes bacterium]|nr:hypothetical protein [Bacillota bacterium]HOQ24314.1 hypothetical protein [Bacillota bacterium]HPT67475.1 hypothetical protein [Bacillota bacterium]